jgi:hypothetical protein
LGVPAPPKRKLAKVVALLAAAAAAACTTPTGTGSLPPDLLLGRPAVVSEGRSDPAVLTDGRVAPDGTAPGGDALALVSPYSTATVELGGTRVVRALSLQASAADVFYVEGSLDGSGWAILWRVPPVAATTELRTRRVALPRPYEVAWLRVRCNTGRPAAVAELAAFESVPAAWPAPDTRPPGYALPPWPLLTSDRLASVYAALAGLLLAAAAWSAAAHGHESPAGRRWRRALLAALGFAALLAWPNAGNLHYRDRVHQWELAHYYLGSKYLAELGYTRLYACAALVDAEDGVALPDSPIRDLRDNRLVPTSAELERAPECRGAFSPERWELFRRDARAFRDLGGPEQWAAVRRDHGFNGTPTWALLGGTLASLAPPSQAQLATLAAADAVLLPAIFALAAAAFGLEGAALAAGFFGTNALAPFGWTGGAFLRYDWLFWLVAGLAALRGRRSVLGGFALAYAALLRAFPLVALAGLGAKAIAEAVERRSLRPFAERWRVAAGAALAVALLGVLPAVVTARPGIWLDFARNSAKHLDIESANNVGLATFLSYDAATSLDMRRDPLLVDPLATWTAGRAAARRATGPARWAAVCAFALLLAAASRRVPDWAAAVLGLGLMPMAFNLSSYYYSAFLAFGLLWAVRRGPGVGLALLAVATNLLAGFYPASDARFAVQSLAVVSFVVAVTAALALERERPSGPAQ